MAHFHHECNPGFFYAWRLITCAPPARAPAPPQPTEEDLDLDREIEYAFDVEEPMAGRAPTGDVE